ncbi:MAG: DUF1249 domain-containing protein [Pseudomonadota bacterium]
MTHTIVHSSPRSPMWVFEENYRLLQKLLPEMEAGGDRYVLSTDDGSQQSLEILILERCRYTTMIELNKPFFIDGVWMPDLRMQLRVYHDARVVEVAAYQGCHRIPARYQVDEGGRYLRDEKRQINLLLHELLQYCRRNDYREQRQPDCSSI